MEHRRQSLQILVTSALIVLTLAAGSGSWAAAATLTERLDETHALAAGGEVTLDNVNGNIDITVWDRNEVRIRAEKRVRAASETKAEEALEELRVEIRTHANSIEVETRHPNRSGFRNWLSSSHISAEVDYQLTVPRNVSLDLVTVNGKVVGRGAQGALKIRTTNGNVEFEDAGGMASVRTTNGSIRVELDKVTPGADLSFVTTNGGIRLALPTTVAASVDASTTNGSITTDFPIQVEGRLSRRRLNGEINGGGGSLELRTTNGSIRISEI